MRYELPRPGPAISVPKLETGRYRLGESSLLLPSVCIDSIEDEAATMARHTSNTVPLASQSRQQTRCPCRVSAGVVAWHGMACSELPTHAGLLRLRSGTGLWTRFQGRRDALNQVPVTEFGFKITMTSCIGMLHLADDHGQTEGIPGTASHTVQGRGYEKVMRLRDASREG